MALGGHAPPGNSDTTVSIGIAEWLHGLGLAHYAEAFAENAIDWEVLPKLTGDDLREIGVAAVGHRRRHCSANSPEPAAGMCRNPARMSAP
jgi:hypothetical protein